MILKDHINVKLHKRFTKCDDIYLEISTEIRSATIIIVWREYITYLSGFRGYTKMRLECDNFVFRKVN